jgi:hypothetical protein
MKRQCIVAQGTSLALKKFVHKFSGNDFFNSLVAPQCKECTRRSRMFCLECLEICLSLDLALLPHSLSKSRFFVVDLRSHPFLFQENSITGTQFANMICK